MGSVDGTIIKVVIAIAAVAAIGTAILIALTWLWWALPWIAAVILGGALGVAAFQVTGSVLLALVPMGITLTVAARVAERWFPWAIDHGPDELFRWVIGLVGIHISAGRDKECPKCRSHSVEVTGTTSSSYDTTATETRRTTHYDSDGNETGYSEHDVEVPAVSTYSTTWRRCKACGHSWST